MSKELSNKLIAVLKEEYNLYEYILGVSKKKTVAIKTNNIDELEAITKLENDFVCKIVRFEKIRERISAELAKNLNINPEDLNITSIKNLINNETGERLDEYQKKTFSVILDLKNSNELNSVLIKNSLDYIDFSVNVLSVSDVTSNNYGDRGIVNDAQKRTYFDVKL